MSSRIFAAPRDVTDINDCYFYHTIELPGYGLQRGAWDLRDGIDDYLGHYDFSGKRVLEVGTANGFICFHMEKCGAEVVGYDLSDQDEWDIVPYANAEFDYAAVMAERKRHMRQINNAWWLSHRLLASNAKVVYGTVYQIPEAIGAVDAATFGSILLHLRDPFQALRKAAALVKDALIITESPAKQHLLRGLVTAFKRPYMEFKPRAEKAWPYETWWRLSPEVIVEFVKVLGFPRVSTRWHRQKAGSGAKDLFTVVARRA